MKSETIVSRGGVSYVDLVGFEAQFGVPLRNLKPRFMEHGPAAHPHPRCAYVMRLIDVVDIACPLSAHIPN